MWSKTNCPGLVAPDWSQLQIVLYVWEERRVGAAKIGQVAQETGLSIDTIRFYEKQGLLKL
jgi:hypothetical protein